MKNVLLWLQKKPFINWVIVIVYYFLVVLPHEQVGLWTVDVFGHLPRDSYNFLILSIGLSCLAIYSIPVFYSIFKGKNRGSKLFYLIATIILSYTVFVSLIIVNIEIVHFFQYGMMALLLFPRIGQYGSTLFWVTLLGAIDEGYQYFYLSPERTDYYDFNDVIINLLGGAFGLIWIKSADLPDFPTLATKWFKSPIFITLFLSLLLFTGLYLAGILHIYPPEDSSKVNILLNRKVPPKEFWSIVPPNIIYHIVQPLEGLVVLTSLLLFYRGLGD